MYLRPTARKCASCALSLFSTHWKVLFVLLVPIVASPLAFVDIPTMRPEAARCAYVVVVMAVFWLLELLPLPVTSLLPVVLFPMLGVLSTAKVTVCYFKEVNMMMLGGLIVAIAIEESGLHRRIAIKTMLLAGTSPRRLLLGFMLTSMFLSMWLSSIAVTVMMIPIALVALDESSEADAGAEQHEADANKKDRLRKMLLLSVAYSANIGGTGTMTGSTPNMALMGILQSQFGDTDITSGLNFSTWFAFATPGMIINLLIACAWLQVAYMCRPSCLSGSRSSSSSSADLDLSADTEKASTPPPASDSHQSKVRDLLREKYEALGPYSPREIAVTFSFALMIALWFLHDPKFMPGWSSLLDWRSASGKKIVIGSATSVIFTAILLFVMVFRDPVDNQWKPILDWKTAQNKLPWGLLILLGGGFAMAEASEASCLSYWMGNILAKLGNYMAPWLLGIVLTLLVSFITEVTSNTATANIVLPILIRMAISLGLPPIYFALPGAITCSYAFMLPVATPPNAMVFEASKTMRTQEMLAIGFVMNLVCVLTTCFSINVVAPLLLDMSVASNVTVVTNTTVKDVCAVF